MAECVIYHILPGEQAGWIVQREDAGAVMSTHRSRTEAILAGRDLAITHPYSLLVVHDRHGKQERQYTYGKKPQNP
jgi:hypothetical protein